MYTQLCCIYNKLRKMKILETLPINCAYALKTFDEECTLILLNKILCRPHHVCSSFPDMCLNCVKYKTRLLTHVDFYIKMTDQLLGESPWGYVSFRQLLKLHRWSLR